MAEGKLIVFEGVDGAGTTTQARLLCERMRALNLPVHATAEPSQGPVGSLLRQALTGRVVVPGATSAREPAWTTMALLFAADRMDHLDSEIEPNLADGVSVVCDRYDHSSVAYQSVAGGGPDAIAWIRELNRFARRPDLTLVLNVPAQVAAERRRARRGRAEIFDADEVQTRLCAFYAGLPGHFPGERVVLVDGTGATEVVAERAWAQVKNVLAVT
jgi:dTMP kinase